MTSVSRFQYFLFITALAIFAAILGMTLSSQAQTIPVGPNVPQASATTTAYWARSIPYITWVGVAPRIDANQADRQTFFDFMLHNRAPGFAQALTRKQADTDFFFQTFGPQILSQAIINGSGQKFGVMTMLGRPVTGAERPPQNGLQVDILGRNVPTTSKYAATVKSEALGFIRKAANMMKLYPNFDRIMQDSFLSSRNVYTTVQPRVTKQMCSIGTGIYPRFKMSAVIFCGEGADLRGRASQFSFVNREFTEALDPVTGQADMMQGYFALNPTVTNNPENLACVDDVVIFHKNADPVTGQFRPWTTETQNEMKRCVAAIKPFFKGTVRVGAYVSGYEDRGISAAQGVDNAVKAMGVKADGYVFFTTPWGNNTIMDQILERVR